MTPRFRANTAGRSCILAIQPKYRCSTPEISRNSSVNRLKNTIASVIRIFRSIQVCFYRDRRCLRFRKDFVPGLFRTQEDSGQARTIPLYRSCKDKTLSLLPANTDYRFLGLLYRTLYSKNTPLFQNQGGKTRGTPSAEGEGVRAGNRFGINQISLVFRMLLQESPA